MIEYSFQPKTTFTEAIGELYKIVTMLRSPEGCPWDREQTPKSTAESLLGEVYEYLDALDDSADHQAEEIGDILENICMILRIHEEYGDFRPVQAINTICEKLVRRHPHVFTDTVNAGNPDEVLNLWNDIKKNVEGRSDNDGEDFFSKIPRSTPVLETAYQMQKKLQKVGFDWQDIDGVYDKVAEELAEVRKAETADEREMEIGDLLFAVVNLARFYKVHPETALNRSSAKIRRRFNALMKTCNERGIAISAENVDIMNEIWDALKATEHKTI